MGSKEIRRALVRNRLVFKKLHTTKPFQRQRHKMVKHTQTIRRLLLTNCLSVFGQFEGLALKGLTMSIKILRKARITFSETIQGGIKTFWTKLYFPFKNVHDSIQKHR